MILVQNIKNDNYIGSDYTIVHILSVNLQTDKNRT